MQLAGKYYDMGKKAAQKVVDPVNKRVKKVLDNPARSAMAGGAAAAGLATIGNIGSGEAAEEGAARVTAEALGAGLLGAGAGALIPSMRRLSRNAIVQNMNQRMIPEIEPSQALRKDAKQALQYLPYGQAGVGTAAVIGAGGLGGMVGGGVANIGNMAGLAIDPEMPGSSNTMNSRLNMQGYV